MARPAPLPASSWRTALLSLVVLGEAAGAARRLQGSADDEPRPGVTRILFGSCSKVDLLQPLWPHIVARRPDLWIWGGDAIYADAIVGPLPHFQESTPEHIRELYAQQLAHPGYRQLLNASVPIIGTWDDHDFGINDGSKGYRHRVASQAAFLDFIGEPLGSPRRTQEGVYASHLFNFVDGSAGVLVVLLDLRFNKDPYSVGPDGDFLGEAQWAWLEQTLAASAADVHIIMSSLQFLQPREIGENWNKFPRSRRRLLNLLAKVKAPLLLSGDVHFAELAAGVDGKAAQPRRLLEVTSSGMTHSWGTRNPMEDHLILRLTEPPMMRLVQSVMPYRYQLRDPATGAQQYDLGLNFGELEFDWRSRSLSVGIIGVDGQDVLRQHFALDLLGVDGGADGPADFGPIGGPPPLWRYLLGCAAVGAVPLLCALLTAWCLWKCSRAIFGLAGVAALKGLGVEAAACGCDSEGEDDTDSDSEEAPEAAE